MSVRPSCPECATPLAAVPSMRTATSCVRRTCRKCHARWQITIRPIQVRDDGSRVDVANLTRIPTTTKGHA